MANKTEPLALAPKITRPVHCEFQRGGIDAIAEMSWLRPVIEQVTQDARDCFLLQEIGLQLSNLAHFVSHAGISGRRNPYALYLRFTLLPLDSNPSHKYHHSEFECHANRRPTAPMTKKR